MNNNKTKRLEELKQQLQKLHSEWALAHLTIEIEKVENEIAYLEMEKK